MILAFRLGPISVRIHIAFLFVALLLGLGARRGTIGIAAWAIGFLVTVLSHELSHAIAARSFGMPAEVHLTLFRPGLGPRIRSLSPHQRVIACLAGPVASLSIAAMAFGLTGLHPSGGDAPRGMLQYLGWLNLGWGLLNLLPILPLDAGHALVALLDRVTKGRGELPVRWLSVGWAVALGLVAIRSGMTLPALICGLVAFQNVQSVRALGAANREEIMRGRLQAAFDGLERGETATAIGHCREILRASSGLSTRRDAVRLLAYAYASTEAWRRLMDLLESGGVLALEDGELENYERAARELGRAEEAQRIALLRHHIA